MDRNSFFMTLFRKRGRPPMRAAKEPALPLVAPEEENHETPAISLSAEEKRMLEEPLDPRVDKILRKIDADKAAAECALKSRSIVHFPHDDSGERHVIQDEDGLWRINPGPPPESTHELLDAL